jgi:Ca2+-transporting ATPase
MIMMLCAAWVVVLAIGDREDATIIAAVVVLNTVIGVVQEVRAQRAVDALTQLAAPRAHVRRDGIVEEIAAADLVPGDLVRLEAGDVVPADLCLADASALQVDEAAMTGESVPVDRTPDEDVLAGTVVTRGRGWGLVVRTGSDSGLGRIAALVASASPRRTPLQRRLAGLSRQLVMVTALLCLLVLALSVARGSTYAEAAILAVSLGVAAIPESLPAVVTVALALGAHRMARRSAVVRSLPAVETLGSVTVLASDKTGTLTEGLLVARRLWTSAGECSVSGDGHGVDGEVTGARAAVAGAKRLLRDAVLCNDASLGRRGDDDAWTPVGDPFDVALLVAAARAGLTADTLARQWTRVQDTPFEEKARSMRTLHQGPDGQLLEVLKGAPEVVLDLVRPGPHVEAARREAHALAAQGYRVLAVSENGEWVGLVGVADPPHRDSREVVDACREAGVRAVMITGDHAETARAVGSAVGILRVDGRVCDGSAVARGEHAAVVDEIDVYSRTRPEQKVDIVEAWQRRGDIVAMTGDGVNDAPALRRADIGVAMGGRGTEVARQAADLVLVDDDLKTVLVAIGEGRRIHANIRTFLRYGLAGGLAELVVILLAPLLGMPLPLTPAMILWINMVTHGVPGVAFGGEPLDPRLMRRPSPSPAKAILDSTLLRQIATAGLLVAAVSMTVGWLAFRDGGPVQTAVFLTLGLGQLGVALALRAPRSGASWRDRGLEAAVLAAGLCQLAGVLVPGLRDLLGTEALTGREILLLSVAAAIPGVLVAAGRSGRRGWAALEVGLAAVAVGLDLLLPALVILVMAILSLVLRREGPASLGFRRLSRPWRTAGVIALLVASWSLLQVGLVMPLLEHVTGGEQDLGVFGDLQGDPGLLAMLLVASWVLGALVEETAFRGLVLTRVRELVAGRVLGAWLAVVAAAVLFSGIHVEQGLVGLVVTFLDGLFFGGLRLHFRSLWAAVLAHGMSNSLGLVVFFAIGPVGALW